MSSNNKTLGIGKVKHTRNGYFLEDEGAERLVEVPRSSLYLTADPKNTVPQATETLIYTAHLNDNRYKVHSACRPADMKHIEGTLVVVDGVYKYGHLKAKQGGYRVFIPFSARYMGTESGQWHGTNAQPNSLYSVMAFRQPETNGCLWVAWSIAEGSRKPTCILPMLMDVPSRVKRLERPTGVQRQTDHQQVEFVKNQSGVIYDISDDNTVSVCSPTCQNVIFTKSLFEPWMKLGRFLTFDGRRFEEGQISKLAGSNAEDAGTIFPCLNINMSPLVLSVNAILNKVSFGKAAWAWNDHIGRIFIPWNAFDRYTNQCRPPPFTGVRLEVAYNGKYDAIPWVATSATICSDEESSRVLEENAQMLKTEDCWHVLSVIDGPENPSIFLTKNDEFGRKVNAFAKITDINGGEIPPPSTLVRVTFYEQKRHQRHALRAVLITSLDKCQSNPKIHISHSGTGVKVFPKLVEDATRKKEKPLKVQTAPAPVKNCWNMKNLGTPMKEVSSDFPTVTEKTIETLDSLLGSPIIRANNNYSSPPLFPPPGIPSVWSGTPVEAKPESVSNQLGSSYLDSPFGLGLDSLCVSGADLNLFSEASVSQSSSDLTGPISDIRNTQSETSSSSPDPVDHEQTFVQNSENESNFWSSFDNVGCNTDSSTFQNIFQ
uniref:Uncharacterized protein n=1 Tax=Caenorhabditis japonica TaxID=281687 RepID=A0A8R1DSS6_CAEJA